MRCTPAILTGIHTATHTPACSYLLPRPMSVRPVSYTHLTYGALKSDTKIKIVTFEDAFHGRTMGSQQAGGSPAGKAWIKNLDKDILQVPFPNAFKYQWADEKDEDLSLIHI